ncbi:unnamed protein product [Brachionus calyciflorus]|uniref:DDE-1 domain-containing protein n=1 Tax=Brachionus calyciflorus TaxID=104777 RepID=A0A813R544_9BILA|nr:unnamed protein product [Brachionus calyciflorus]
MQLSNLLSTINSLINRIPPHLDRNGFNEATLIWDNAPCHKKQTVIDAATSKNLKLLFVPPRTTNLVQPADIAWFKPLKSKFNRFWTDWFINGEHTFTANQNLRSPGYENIINWVSVIWNEFDTTLLKESFDMCGLLDSSNLHSILDKLMHEDIIYKEIIEDNNDSNVDSIIFQEDQFID